MADLGKQVIGIMAALAGMTVLFAPLGAVLIVAAKTGRGRVLAWAFGGSLLAGVAWLASALAVRQAFSPQVAAWWLLGAPWASALGAIWGWRRERARTLAAEGKSGGGGETA